jgi:hypothetical protein
MTDPETAAALDLLTDATTAQTAQAILSKQAVDTAVAAFASTTQVVADIVPDADKPISTFVAEALATKQATLVDGENISTVNGVSLLSGDALVIARGAVEMPVLDYENRADLRTPVLPIPLNGDVVNIPNLGIFQFKASFDYVEDDEMVFVAVDPADGLNPGSLIGQWVLANPAYQWIEAQKMFENSVISDFQEDESFTNAALDHIH